jgi:opacity protein-like surface antigen
MNRIVTATLGVAALAALATPAIAQSGEAPRGFYFGGSLTQSRFDDGAFNVEDIDDEDNSWKVIAGARLDERFGIEANYVDFGEASAPLTPRGGPLRAEAKAFSLFAVGYVPVPYVDFFAKIGAARIDVEGASGAALFEDDETEFAYGAGVQWRLRNFALRAEYEKFDTDIAGDLDLISVGFTYTFPSGR